MQYKRAAQKFVSKGMDLNRPPDLMDAGKYPVLKNVRSYQEGRMETRGPLASVNVVPTTPDLNIVSSFRLNDYVVNNFQRFLKVGSNLYFGDTAYTQIDTGYSGLPFSPVAYRPDQSARVWGYLGDPGKMRKVNTSGENFQIGVVPPNLIPTAELGIPLYYAVDQTDGDGFNNPANWYVPPQVGNPLSNTCVSSAVSLLQRLTSVTIGSILYDSGSTGWACIAPTGGNFEDITAGMRLILNSTETVTVEDIHKPYNAASNAVQQIIYDVGTTGLCTVQPTLAVTNLDRNTMILIGGEKIRIISVTAATNGINSFRCITTGAHAAGDAITTPDNGSFRAYTTATHAAGETLTAVVLKFPLILSTSGGGFPAGFEGDVAFNLAPGSGFNFGNVGNRPITPDDYIHLGLFVDVPQNITEIKLMMDVDAQTTATYTVNDCNQNAYYASVRANDLAAAIASQTTTYAARTAALQLQQQNAQTSYFRTDTNPNAVAAPTSQLGLGESQYTEFKWKIGELFRIGAAQQVDLSNVGALQIRVIINNDCTVYFSDLWVGGGYGVDTWTNLTPYIYRQRFRSSETGAHSLPGPAMRSGIVSQRQQVRITGVTSTDPQIDKIDWERLGGNNLEWHYIGTTLNSAPLFIDEQIDSYILVNPPLDTDAFQPFPLSDVPRKATVTVAGTAIKYTSGDTFNPAWARGTIIIINGIVSTVYAQPVGSVLQIADSMPPGTGLTMEIPNPILAGQPLPYTWGPYRECIFACGNVLDAGSVYYTKPTDPDSAPDTNRVEVCSPSEALVGGCVYDGRCYTFSDKQMYALIPSFRTSTVQIVGASDYDVVPVPNSKGLWAPYALAVGPKIWYLSSDGIYETDGGNILKISNDISPLFPEGDRAGYASNNFHPVQMTAAGDASQIPYLRLEYHNGELYFDYYDCNGNPMTMVYDTKDKAWYAYVYFEDEDINVNFHVSETSFEANDAQTKLIVGTSAGLLYEAIGVGSGVETINCTIRTPALDVGDFRAKKIYGDIIYDLNTQGIDLTVTPYIDNYQTALPFVVYNNEMRSITAPQDLVSGAGQFARNIGIEFDWSLTD